MVRVAEQFEKDHFHAGNPCPGGAHPVEADGFVEGAAGGNGIGGNLHFEPPGEQVGGRLVDADMRLDARQNDLLAAQRLDILHKLRFATATERHLFEDGLMTAQQDPDFRRGLAHARGVLLQPQDRDANGLNPLDQLLQMGHQILAFVHDLHEEPLHIDDDQNGILFR